MLLNMVLSVSAHKKRLRGNKMIIHFLISLILFLKAFGFMIIFQKRNNFDLD